MQSPDNKPELFFRSDDTPPRVKSIFEKLGAEAWELIRSLLRHPCHDMTCLIRRAEARARRAQQQSAPSAEQLLEEIEAEATGGRMTSVEEIALDAAKQINSINWEPARRIILSVLTRAIATASPSEDTKPSAWADALNRARSAILAVQEMHNERMTLHSLVALTEARRELDSAIDAAMSSQPQQIPLSAPTQDTPPATTPDASKQQGQETGEE